MTTKELKTYRQALLDLDRRMGGDYEHIRHVALRQGTGEANSNLSSIPLHLADLGSELFDREISLMLMEREGHLLEQVDAALERIEEGTFGRCELCRRSIPKERLRILPFAAHCVSCARELEASNASI